LNINTPNFYKSESGLRRQYSRNRDFGKKKEAPTQVLPILKEERMFNLVTLQAWPMFNYFLILLGNAAKSAVLSA